ncbi:MAG: hypothetical protein M1837_002085 [Sclerophora amabilis]|nr:MAG: hypothetical protein M1837_002085 [Sclerophora amabilis]
MNFNLDDIWPLTTPIQQQPQQPQQQPQTGDRPRDPNSKMRWDPPVPDIDAQSIKSSIYHIETAVHCVLVSNGKPSTSRIDYGSDQILEALRSLTDRLSVDTRAKIRTWTRPIRVLRDGEKKLCQEYGEPDFSVPNSSMSHTMLKVLRETPPIDDRYAKIFERFTDIFLYLDEPLKSLSEFLEDVITPTVAAGEALIKCGPGLPSDPYFCPDVWGDLDPLPEGTPTWKLKVQHYNIDELYCGENERCLLREAATLVQELRDLVRKLAHRNEFLGTKAEEFALKYEIWCSYVRDCEDAMTPQHQGPVQSGYGGYVIGKPSFIEHTEEGEGRKDKTDYGTKFNGQSEAEEEEDALLDIEPDDSVEE